MGNWVNFHAPSTAERQVMIRMADGHVSAVIGTGSKVPTADLAVSDKGTAGITDPGRTGSQLSVGGLDPEIEIRQFLTQVPERSADTWAQPELRGVLMDLDGSGCCTAAECLAVPCDVETEEKPHEPERDDKPDNG